MAKKLSLKTLPEISNSVSVPKYKREDVTAGIIHIGVGNFHRAHQAVFLDALFNTGQDLDWGIVGAGVKPYDAAMRDKLKDQDFLTTVVELDPKGFSARVTGAMIDFLPPDVPTLVARLVDPTIRIVSLTITEGGYYINATTGGLDVDHADLRHDAQHPDDPKTVFGIIIKGLKERMKAGMPPFTIMSCDNLPENGHVTKRTIVGLANMMSADLGNWISDNVAFPNGMVDCITPATSDRERKMVAEKFGIIDAVPVACEPFRQWVLEDNFPQGRPALEKVGVEFVKDVAPFELMKLRILNGGHAAIAYPGALLGHHFVHDAMADPLVVGFLRKLENTEILPTLKPIPSVDFGAYYQMVETRFSNPEVGDTIARLCLDGSNRQPKFILPTIHEALALGRPVEGLALEVALWAKYAAGLDDSGNAIELVDDRATLLRERALAAKETPDAFLQIAEVFGNLADDAVFRDSFAAALNRLWAEGTVKVLADYIE